MEKNPFMINCRVGRTVGATMNHVETSAMFGGDGAGGGGGGVTTNRGLLPVPDAMRFR